MGKKSSQSSMKVDKRGKKQQINSPIKISRPKYEVYITDSSNFKNLVQGLTGNGNFSTSPTTPSIPISPPVAYTEVLDYGYQENSLDNLSFDSPCFSTPLDGSPDLRVQDSMNYEMLENSQNMDFAAQYRELEALLMEMDSGSYNYDSNCGIINQLEVCVYDYDLPCFV